MSTEGKKFTLEGCSAESITLSAPGIPTESFSPQCILEGELYERDSPIQFDELALRYTHLDAWTHVNGFHVALRDEQVKAVDVRYEAPQPIVAAGEDFEFEIGFDWSMTPPSASAASFQLTQHAAIRVRFRKAVVLDELLGYVYQFRNFLGLAVGRPVRTSFVAGIVRVTPDEASDIRARRARPRRIEITYRPNIPPVDSAPSVDPDDMLFTLPEAHSRLSELLANWFAKATILRPVFDLYYFGTIYNRHAFVEQQFLNLMQALETYHRRTDARTDLPEDQHAERVAAIIRSAPPEYDQWLQAELKYSNELGLRQRIKDVLRRCPRVAKKITGYNPRLFARRVYLARNYLTHYDESLEDSAPRGPDLYSLIVQLRALVEMCILRELGFDCEEIDRFFDRCRRYEEIRRADD